MKLLRTFAFLTALASVVAFSLPRTCEAATIVKLETTLGDIVLQLEGRKAPETTKNFLQYVQSGFYNGTVFHRVIKGFMIQGGGMSAEMKEKPTGAPIKNESTNGLRNDKYTIAMARTSNPDSATAQFFINTKTNSFLNKDRCQDGVGYAVFGHVIQGKEVVDAIERVPTKRFGRYDDVPQTPVVIRNATILSH